MSRGHRSWRALVGAVVLAAVLGACSGDGGGGGACGPVRREPLDTRGVHVLPGAPEVEYRTDPPTSGPHQPTPSTEDVRREPIARPVQVGLLEEGRVLLQHHGLSDDDRAVVEGLAGDGVVVAPAEDALPDGAAVVATAWVTKQACTTADESTLRTFAEENLEQGPGDHG